MKITTIHFFLLCSFLSNTQVVNAKGRKDIGLLTLERSGFDVLHYEIRLTVYPEKQSIEGSNRIKFKQAKSYNGSTMQLDFVQTMHIDSILFENQSIRYYRSGNRVQLQLKHGLEQNKEYFVEVFFNGTPHVAELAPWKGGFVWSKDDAGNDWVGLACESLGPSAWLPCKDHWSDEAEGMDMYLTVPEHLTGVSNGKLISESETQKGFKTFHWQVVNTINTYNISVNVGKYLQIRDTFIGSVRLPLTYYILEYNKDQAEKHFIQVHGMLRAFEHYFGPYPFPEDSYKLVETPYWGMEHQSCIAYGNQYKNNAYGFDFIIVHESGHEWFANNITAYDPADMWIHESFTTYAEALYLEFNQNISLSVEYLLEEKKKIVSKRPMQGPRDVYFHDRTDSDIYYKGTWMLHTMRSALNNDSLWFAMLKELNVQFRHSITNTEEIIAFINRNTGVNWDLFFRQYLFSSQIPVLKIRSQLLNSGLIRYTFQLKHTVKGLSLPIHIKTASETQNVMLWSNKESYLDIPANFDLYSVLNKYYLLTLEYQ